MSAAGYQQSLTGRRDGKTSRRNTFSILLAAVSLTGPLVFHQSTAQANLIVNVPNGTTDLTSLGATSSSDLTFQSGTAYSPAAFTINSNLSVGTLDDADATPPSLSISNTSATTDTLTLAGGTNSVAPNPNDLLYVASGGSLAVAGTGGSANNLGLTFSSPGNLDIVGSGSATLTTQLTSTQLITMTGGGTLTLSPVSSVTVGNSTLTGGFAIANGAVVLGGATANAPNFALGASGKTVTLGSTGNNASLNFTDTASGVAQNYIIAGNGADQITNSSGSASSTSDVVFAAANTVTLENNLTVADLVASSPLGTGNLIGFRGVISQSGGTYGITIPATNVGTVDLRGANTFGGGVTINGGAVTFNASGASNLASGPLGLGTSTVSLGNATLTAGGAFSLYNPIISTSTGATLAIDSGSATAPTFFGQINLTNDPITLTSVASTQSGVDRIRLGDGGVVGGNNIIVNDPLNDATTGVGSDAMRLDGNGTATTWTGNLIIQAGLASIGGSSNANALTAIGSSNVVEIASGALFDYSSNTGGNSTNFSPTIAGLSNYSGGGGTVFDISGNNETLNLAGNGNYSFSGSIADSTTAGKTTALVINLASLAASQTLAGPSTYTGGTTINGGELILANSSGSATGAGPVALSGGALEGKGSSSGALTVTGTGLIAPGVNASGPGNDFGDPETLTLGSLTLTNAQLDFDLGTSALTAGASDLISTSGTLTLGTVNFTFNPLGASLDTANAYTLISGATGTAPSLAGVTGTVIGGEYTPTFSLSGDNLEVSFVPVPEPATAGLLAASSLFLFKRQRRKS